MKTVVVERNTGTVAEPRAVSIDDEALRTMKAAGVIDEVLEHIVPGYGSHYYSPRGRCFAKVEPTATPNAYPKRSAFRQPILEQQLKDALRRFECVSAVFGWCVTNMEQSSAKVTLQLRGPQNHQDQITCDYLVGCDGAASTVRDHLGAALDGTTSSERWLIIDLENHDNPTKHTQVFCDRRRPCITLPGPNRTRRFEFKLLANEKDEDLLAPDMVDRLLSTHGADLNAFIRRKVVYRFHARVARRWSVGRIYLAGDAAHLSPPFAGQGMNSGIRDAHNLAWKLAAVVQGRIGARRLESYERERREHVWEMIQLALRMGRVMAPRSDWSGFLTRFCFRTLSLWPPARDYIVQMKYRPQPRYRTGFVIGDGRGERKTLVGRLFPQPCVMTDGGRRVLLDEVLGTGFSLLARTSQPVQFFAQFLQPVWDRLGAIRLAVLPTGAPPPERSNEIITVTETDDTFASVFGVYAGCALLLRPDRYVMARISSDEISEAATSIEKLLNGTCE